MTHELNFCKFKCRDDEALLLLLLLMEYPSQQVQNLQLVMQLNKHHCVQPLTVAVKMLLDGDGPCRNGDTELEIATYPLFVAATVHY